MVTNYAPIEHNRIRNRIERLLCFHRRISYVVSIGARFIAPSLNCRTFGYEGRDVVNAPTSDKSLDQKLRNLLQKHADILRRQNRLIQDDRPLGDLEAAVDAAQNVLPLADEHILVVFHARAVNEEIGMWTSISRPSSFLMRMLVIKWRVRDGGISAQAFFA